jgi:hypothetical protein
MRNVPVDIVAPAIAIKIARDKETSTGYTCIDEKGTNDDGKDSNNE